LQDDEIINILWKDELMADDENGGNRQLGLLFCYKLAIKDMTILINNIDCTRSFVEIMSRWFHLKLCRWGRETVNNGEEHVEPSRDLMKLFITLNHPQRSWHPPPRDGGSKRILERGLEIHSRMIHSQQAQMLKIFLQFWEQEFTQTLNSVEYTTLCEKYRGQMRTIKESPLSIKKCININDIPTSFINSTAIPYLIKSYNCSKRIIKPSIMKDASDETNESKKTENDNDTESSCPDNGVGVTFDELNAFAKMPLSEIDINDFITFLDSNNSIPSNIPFDLSKQPEAKTPIAVDMVKRLKEDMKGFIHSLNSGRTPELSFLTKRKIDQQINNTDNDDSYTNAINELNILIQRLTTLSKSDESKMDQSINLILKETNSIIYSDDNDDLGSEERILFELSKISRQIVAVDITNIMGSMMCNEYVHILHHINPFLSKQSLDSILNLSVETMLRTSRVVQSNRVASAARQLSMSLIKLKKYHTNTDISKSKIISLGKGIHIKASNLANSLVTKRHFVTPDSMNDSVQEFSYDPRFLAFEYIFNIVLRKRQVEIVNSFHHEATEGSGQIVQQMIMVSLFFFFILLFSSSFYLSFFLLEKSDTSEFLFLFRALVKQLLYHHCYHYVLQMVIV
jgi:hypothetical protein